MFLRGTGCTLKLECQCGRRTCHFRNCTLVGRDAVGTKAAREAAQDAVLVLGALGVEALAIGQGALRDARVGIRVVA